MEAFYRSVHAEDVGPGGPQFPPAYPTSVLLGCVEVAGCLQVGPWGSAAPTACKPAAGFRAAWQRSMPPELALPRSLPLTHRTRAGLACIVGSGGGRS